MRMAAATVEKKKTFDAAFKLKVIDYALQCSNRAAARIHGIVGKRVHKRTKQNEELEKLPAKRSSWMCRLQGNTIRR